MRYFLLVVFITLALFGPSTYLSAEGIKVFTDIGPHSGQIYSIAIDPTNPDKLFVGAYLGGGLYVTTNGGNSWQAVNTNGTIPGEDEFKNHAVYSIKIAPVNPDIIWVDHNYWAEKSTDGGQTWTHIRNSTMQRDCQNCGGVGDNFRLCNSLAIHPSDSNTVYVGAGGPSGSYSSGAIYKTIDGGTTWEKMSQGSNLDYPVVSIDIDPSDHNIVSWQKDLLMLHD